jgi:transcriptional regulator with XRE-family HTH domain
MTTPELQLSFSNRVRDFRKLRGETVEGFASTVGVNPITLVRWEAGRSQPSQQAAEQLRTLGFGEIALSETKAASTPRLHRSDSFSSTELRGAVRKKIQFNGTSAIVVTKNDAVCNCEK